MTHEQVEAIWSVIQTIGGELDEPLDPGALDWLLMRGFVELRDGAHRLTAKGEAAYVVLESGDGEVAEIDLTQVQVELKSSR